MIEGCFAITAFLLIVVIGIVLAYYLVYKKDG